LAIFSAAAALFVVLHRVLFVAEGSEFEGWGALVLAAFARVGFGVDALQVEGEQALESVR